MACEHLFTLEIRKSDGRKDHKMLDVELIKNHVDLSYSQYQFHNINRVIVEAMSPVSWLKTIIVFCFGEC